MDLPGKPDRRENSNHRTDDTRGDQAGNPKRRHGVYSQSYERRVDPDRGAHQRIAEE